MARVGDHPGTRRAAHAFSRPLRPRLRPGVVAIPARDKVLVTSAIHGAVLRGRDAAALVDVLMPQLDGSRGLAEIIETFDTHDATAVRQVIEMLASSGVVRDAGADPPHHLTAAELAYHGEVCQLLEATGDGPAARLEQVLTTPVVVMGDDRTLEAQVRALLRLGFRLFEIADSMLVSAPVRLAVDELVVAEASLEPRRRVELLWHEEIPEAVTGDRRGAVLVCHRLEAGADEVARLEHDAVSRGMTFAAVVWDAGHAWLSPPVVDTADAGWSSMCWRLRASGRLAWTDGRPGGPAEGIERIDSRYRTIPALAVASNRAALSVLQTVAEPTTPRRGWHLEAHTLVSGPVKVSPHSFATPRLDEGTEHVGDGTAGRGGATPPVGEFSTRVASLIDERAGPLLTLGEGAYPQVPLSVTSIAVADGAGRLPPGHTVKVTEAGLDVAESRHRAARRALEVAQALATDPARRPRRGHEIESDRIVAVEPPLPGLAVWDAPDRRRLPGLASGASHREALLAGLLGLAAETLALRGVGAAPRPLDTSWGTTSRGTTLLDLLASVAPGVRPVLLGRPNKLVAVGTWDGERWSALVVDPDPVAAFEAALLEAVSAAQGVADPSRPAVRLTADPPATDASARPCPEDLAADPVAASVALLHDAGVRPVALLLDDDPAITAVVGHVLAVVDDRSSCARGG